ncbi:ankyrin repeat domain-containing protein 54 isoform X2 [Pseudomyrmex gracilis]|uniref:ankyrin repeat domain-containing protein 54 isoform X2 n=1 Tax=Pseudomyrmex gracilis TaxID=219809 RepID=UPI00099499BB|nr:ankyrin repeat domain-containing protein 54 isoform X2 [Pseudomyrmex gracilis]
MTSVDSGVETSNDSNDNSNVQQEAQHVPGHSACPYHAASYPPVVEPLFFKVTSLSGHICDRRDILRKTYAIDKTIDKLKRIRKRHNGICKEKLKTRLNIAVCLNNISMAETFLQNSGPPNYQDAFGRTPLHYAACKGYTDIVRLLLKKGANPNLHDCIGNTPLHLATVTSNHEIVKLLVEAGTDIQAPDLRGKNPLNLAMTKLRMLQSYKNEDMIALRKEAYEITQLLTMHLKEKMQNEAKAQKQIEVLTDFCSRLSLSNTSDQVQDGVKDLLENINALDITG